MKITFLFAAIAGGVAFGVAHPSQEDLPGGAGTQLTALEIIEKMRDVYSTCSSYRDEGQVETVFVYDDDRTRNVVKNFETAFVRPDRFFFEYTERDVVEFGGREYVDDDRYVIWLYEEGVSTWWTVRPEIRRWASVKEAVSAARGVSSAASTRVASLLIPEVQWEDLLHVNSANVLNDEKLNGVRCWRIEARSGDRTYLVWIDREQHLLRQVYWERDSESADFSTRTTTTYHPQINVEIPASQFDFEPPK